MSARGVMSLRQRLLIVLVLPLLVVALALGAWRVVETRRMTADLYDRALLSAALAISRDVGATGGEALSPTTLDLIARAAGSPVFYHVKGPDGSFVIGYATPPLDPAMRGRGAEGVRFFDGTYRGTAIRAVRLSEYMDLGWVSGRSTVSVWQDRAVRRAFTRSVVTRTAAVIAILLGVVITASWFGLRFAMHPLRDLGDAIDSRSPDDLRPIRRPMPPELAGVVGRLNALFGQVGQAAEAQNAFISDAAHQLRNPIAGLRSLAEAVARKARSDRMIERAGALVEASDHIGRIVDQLLSHERATSRAPTRDLPVHDLTAIAARTVERAAPALLRAGHDISFLAGPPMPCPCEPVRIGEALGNLIENAAEHGGRAGLEIAVQTAREGDALVLRVTDDGVGLSPADQERAFSRFSQLGPGRGSGLGLSIAEAICRAHGGSLAVEAAARGASIAMRFPAMLAADGRIGEAAPVSTDPGPRA